MSAALSRLWSGFVDFIGFQKYTRPDLAVDHVTVASFYGIEQATKVQQYQRLWSYYVNNALYRDLIRGMDRMGIPHEAMTGIFNPAHAAVEFYPAVLWPGSIQDGLPLELPPRHKNPEALRDAIWKIMEWSNWEVQKQVFARKTPALGDYFLKVNTKNDDNGNPYRVYIRPTEPVYVREFEEDEQGHLKLLRIDIPQIIHGRDDKVENVVHVEFWEKEHDRFRHWRVKPENAVKDITQLGEPLVNVSITEKFGFDFIPADHARFLHDGTKYGLSVLTPAIDKIDEVNRMGTRGNQLMFRHGGPMTQLVATTVDADGRATAPPRFLNDDNGIIKITGEDMIMLPNGYEMKATVANLPYLAHIAMMQEMMGHLRDTDLPELEYGRFPDVAQIHGPAMENKMVKAISRAIEARGHMEFAIVSAIQKALTIAQNAGLKEFKADLIGTYETGDFNFKFKKRPVIPMSTMDEVNTQYLRAKTNVLRNEYRNSKAFLELEGLPIEVVEQIIEENDFGSISTPDASDMDMTIGGSVSQGDVFDKGLITT